MFSLHFIFLTILLVASGESQNSDEEHEEFLNYANEKLLESTRLRNFAYWNFTVNLSKSTENNYTNIFLQEAKVWREIYKKSLKYEWTKVEPEILKRQMKLLQKPTLAILPDKSYKEYLTGTAGLENLYVQKRFCSYGKNFNCELSLYPNLIQIFSQSRDPGILKYYWKAFYDGIAEKTSKIMEKFVQIYQNAMKAANYTSTKEWWFGGYDNPEVERDLNKIYKSLLPFYKQLHAYVRHRLRLYYSSKFVSSTSSIPMHLLGSLWAEKWSNIQDIIVPYPKKGIFDITAEMNEQQYDIPKMFQIADDFMDSLGLRKLPNTTWERCIGTPKRSLKVYCPPRSFDFYKDDDVCVRACIHVSHEGFQSVFHEMGHLQYYLQYANKPFLLRDSPTPAFHEAIGDVIALSAMSPKHLKNLGLLKNYTYDNESRINYLFRIALEKIVFIPFALSADQYRWSLIRNFIDKEAWNCGFWKLREDFSGIMPPEDRTNKYYDAFVNYYIGGDVEFTRFAQAIILQFQLYKSVCTLSGEFKVNSTHNLLDNCDFFGNKDVGKAFQTLLSSGAEEQWNKTLHKITRFTEVSAKSLMLYFAPLHEWLQKTNKENNVTIGWTSSQRCILALSSGVKIIPQGIIKYLLLILIFLIYF